MVAGFATWSSGASRHRGAGHPVDGNGGSGAVGSGGLLASGDSVADHDRAGSRRAQTFVVAAGGADPASSQVSIEQDAARAIAILSAAGPGTVLFAGGPGTPSVQVFPEDPAPASLREMLGEVFDPRDSRGARFRYPELRVDGALTFENLGSVLERELVRRDPAPLNLFIATHGGPGEQPRDNVVDLWGGFGMSAVDVAAIADAPGVRRTLRLIVAACFAGGLAEMVFRGADPVLGSPEVIRCGLFATRSDLESTGCDPSTSRERDESYGLHFWHALGHRDREGAPLDVVDLDLDRDGRVSFLEAHARAVIAAQSVDVPVTTSERWLWQSAWRLGLDPEMSPLRLPAAESRETPYPSPSVLVPPDDVLPAAEGGEPLAWHALPPAELLMEDAPSEMVVERAVVLELGERLGLRGVDGAVRAWEEVETARALLDDRVAEREDALDDAWARLRISLLARHAYLDDPWDPRHALVLRRDGERIAHLLTGSPQAVAYRRVLDEYNLQAAELDQWSIRAAVVTRLVQAYESLALASLVRERDPAAWDYFLRLRACEGGSP